MYIAECHCPECKDHFEVRVKDPQEVDDGEHPCPSCGTPLELDDYYDEDDVPSDED